MRIFRRRRLVAVVAFAAAAMGTVLQPVRATEPGPDWVELEIVAGPEGADVEVNISVDASGGSDGPLLWGVGRSVDDYGTVSVFDEGGGRTGLGLAGLESPSVRWGGSYLDFSSYGAFDDLAPGTRVSTLVFVANAGDPWFWKQARVTAGAASLTWRHGRGTVGLPARASDGDGVGVVAAGAAAGELGQRAEVGAGIAGAMSGDCVSCELGWSSPDGRAGADSSFGVPQVLRVASATAPFAGPAGTWRWAWSGARAAQPQVTGSPGLVAWAPIGERWVHYATPFPPGYQIPRGARVEPPAPIDVTSGDGPAWVAYIVEVVEGAELRFAATPRGDGARVVAAGYFYGRTPANLGHGHSYEWDGGATDTHVEVAGDVLASETEGQVDPYLRPAISLRGLSAGRVIVGGYVAGLGGVDHDFVLEGRGATIVGRTTGTSAFVLGDRQFASLAQVDAHRPAPWPVSGAGASLTAGGLAERTISGSFLGWFTSAGDGQLAAEHPDGTTALGSQTYELSAPGRYRFHALADASSTAESVVVIGADLRLPTA